MNNTKRHLAQILTAGAALPLTLGLSACGSSADSAPEPPLGVATTSPPTAPDAPEPTPEAATEPSNEATNNTASSAPDEAANENTSGTPQTQQVTTDTVRQEMLRWGETHTGATFTIDIGEALGDYTDIVRESNPDTAFDPDPQGTTSLTIEGEINLGDEPQNEPEPEETNNLLLFQGEDFYDDIQDIYGWLLSYTGTDAMFNVTTNEDTVTYTAPSTIYTTNDGPATHYLTITPNSIDHGLEGEPLFTMTAR